MVAPLEKDPGGENLFKISTSVQVQKYRPNECNTTCFFFTLWKVLVRREDDLPTQSQVGQVKSI